MPENLKVQDATVLVRPTSRYGNIDYDEVSVFSTIVTSSELTEQYYVPDKASLPKHVMDFIRAEGLEFRPYTSEELMEGTEDILADENKIGETANDSARVMLKTALVKAPLRQVTKSQNEYVYELRYDYKLFPTDGNTFDFQIRLPIDGKMPNGSKVALTVITPKDATIVDEETKGIADNGANIEEIKTELKQSGKVATEFQYQQDPAFNVRYQY